MHQLYDNEMFIFLYDQAVRAIRIEAWKGYTEVSEKSINDEKLLIQIGDFDKDNYILQEDRGTDLAKEEGFRDMVKSVTFL